MGTITGKMAEVPQTSVKVDPVMEKPWQRAKRVEKMEFWRKSAYPPMEIEPMRNERSRLAKAMTPEERALRKQWIQDQTLRHEKRNITAVKPYNIFRRIYRTPLNLFESALAKSVGAFPAHVTRSLLGKLSLGVVGFY